MGGAQGPHALPSKRQTLGHLTIFTDAQAAVWRMTSGDYGPDQLKYAVAAAPPQGTRNLDRDPVVSQPLRIERNEKADEWAKMVADELTRLPPRGVVPTLGPVRMQTRILGGVDRARGEPRHS